MLEKVLVHANILNVLNILDFKNFLVPLFRILSCFSQKVPRIFKYSTAFWVIHSNNIKNKGAFYSVSHSCGHKKLHFLYMCIIKVSEIVDFPTSQSTKTAKKNNMAHQCTSLACFLLQQFFIFLQQFYLRFRDD